MRDWYRDRSSEVEQRAMRLAHAFGEASPVCAFCRMRRHNAAQFTARVVSRPKLPTRAGQLYHVSSVSPHIEGRQGLAPEKLIERGRCWWFSASEPMPGWRAICCKQKSFGLARALP